MRIAILDDESAELKLLSSVLETYKLSDGNPPICAQFSKSQELLRQLKRETFDLVILDWKVPEISGLQVLQWMKTYLVIPPPVIMLTSRATEDDVVQAFNAGAVDYISKPFRQAELLARLSNALRQYKHDVESTDTPLIFRNIRFYTEEKCVTVNDVPFTLTSREFNLALLLFKNQGRLLSRSYLYEHLWSRNENLCSRTLDTHIYRIRNKLQLTSEFGWILSTVYGYGYRLEELPQMLNKNS